MLLLVNGATLDVPNYDVGTLIVPRGGHKLESLNLQPGKWAIDNGAYSAFDAEAFATTLEKFQGVPGCLFVTAPDVVGDAAKTLELFADWHHYIRARGYPVALVAQDGLEMRAVPWAFVDALFIGGTTAFKFSKVTQALIQHALQTGRWVHMGRVNTLRRLHHAETLGVQSVDGTYASRWPKIGLPKMTGWIEHLRTNKRLF